MARSEEMRAFFSPFNLRLQLRSPRIFLKQHLPLFLTNTLLQPSNDRNPADMEKPVGYPPSTSIHAMDYGAASHGKAEAGAGTYIS